MHATLLNCTEYLSFFWGLVVEESNSVDDEIRWLPVSFFSLLVVFSSSWDISWRRWKLADDLQVRGERARRSLQPKGVIGLVAVIYITRNSG